MLFGNKNESNLRSALKMVEETLVSLAPEYVLEPIGPGTAFSWRLHKGPLVIHTAVRTRDEGNYLRVVASLPAREPDTAFYRRLLELNGGELSGAAFALEDGALVICLERTTVDLDQSEVRDAVHRIAGYAERYRDVGNQ
jgi:hypothetical protein